VNRPADAILRLKEGSLPSSPQSLRSARFGGLSLDLRAGELRNGPERIRLQDKPFQMLRLLLEHSGEVVTVVRKKSDRSPSAAIAVMQRASPDRIHDVDRREWMSLQLGNPLECNAVAVEARVLRKKIHSFHK
jgi:hypothetical protein